MSSPNQLRLQLGNSDGDIYSGHELGTFKDSMRAPIFRWFRYPAGYSYKFVDESFDIFNINKGNWVYDPFSGTGTTLICAKKRNINAYGVEAHSFVHWVADVKLNWSFQADNFRRIVSKLLGQISENIESGKENTSVEGIFPELIYKCYHPDDLIVLYLIREFINKHISNKDVRNFMKLALTDTLRGAAVANTGWPYIKPKKHPEKYPVQDALKVFQETVTEMASDIYTVLNQEDDSEQLNILGDSRQKQDLEAGQIDFAITSPPYLNNYDYADRTRLETYFWGITETWSDITAQFRDELMVAATTQVRRREHDVNTALSKDIQSVQPSTYKNLQQAILSLSEIRLTKGGRKSYDLMTALYFNGILSMLRETYRVLKKDSYFCLVLGDSAPYGVHIPTDDYIGQIALGLGFSDYQYHQLRVRGKKWKDNPQRHKVQLREGIVILRK